MAQPGVVGNIEEDDDDTGELGGMLVGMPARVKQSRALPPPTLPKEGLQLRPTRRIRRRPQQGGMAVINTLGGD